MSAATTTLAFLSLPLKRTTQMLEVDDTRNYDDDWQEAFMSMSQLVSPSQLKLKAEQKSRFDRVMRVLSLKPFVYFVQVLSLGEVVVPNTPCKSLSCSTGIKPLDRNSKDSLRDNIKKIIKGMLRECQTIHFACNCLQLKALQESDWPQPMLLAASHVECSGP
jgi:hypothetical protein